MKTHIQDNIYDKRINNRLYAIISTDKYDTSKHNGCSVAIILYLYYSDSNDRYMKYIKQIPNWIDIYIISSNKKLLEDMKRTYSQDNIFFKEKPNVGRDISALLVTSNEFIWNYKYICFIHDKKEKGEFRKKDTDAWIENLWGNTIENGMYIENVLAYMDNNDKIGMLCPMEPTDVYTEDNFWGENYNNTIELAKKIGIDTAKIVKEKPPISLGSVFWAKPKALEKLFDYGWKYSDFVEEPMPDDGTISHAIERVFPYVVQDAGYEVHTVMNKEYASKIIAEMYDNWLKCGIYLRNKMGIRKAYEIDNIDKKISEIKEFCSRFKKIYMYGAGRFAIDLHNLCKSNDINLDGCIVTDINSEKNIIKDICIFEFGTVDMQDCGIILAVNKGIQEKVIDKLHRAGISDIYIFRK